MSASLFVAPDGADEPTLWRVTDENANPEALVRLSDLPTQGRFLWETFTAAAIKGDTHA